MSGSPIFLDGRLAGAYSYSLSAFEVEPVAGVTPIDLMLTEMRRPIPPGFWPLERARAAPGGAAATRIAPAPAPHASLDRFDGAARHVRPRGARAPARRRASAPSPTRRARSCRRRRRIMLGGVSDTRGGRAPQARSSRSASTPLQGGGGGRQRSARAARTSSTAAGSACELARGDVSRMGLGTATSPTAAGKVAGFGHPCSAAATRRSPRASAACSGSTRARRRRTRSASARAPLGTLVQDRQTAIVLDENITAPAIPIDVDIVGAVGAPKTHWHTEVTDDQLHGAGPGRGRPRRRSSRPRRASAATSRGRCRRRSTSPGTGLVELEDVGDRQRRPARRGRSGSARSSSTRVGDVLSNPWEHARITKRRGTLRGQVRARPLAPARRRGARSGRRRRRARRACACTSSRRTVPRRRASWR